jgi:hypothetical protein
MKAVITVVFLCASFAANAAPVYLECNALNKHTNKTAHYKITLDEDAQTAVFTDDDLTFGNSFTRPAQFTQTEVKFNWKVHGLSFTIYYRIDRTNLEFSASFEGVAEKTDYGICKIAEPVKRQF